MAEVEAQRVDGRVVVSRHCMLGNCRLTELEDNEAGETDGVRLQSHVGKKLGDRCAERPGCRQSRLYLN